jgi:hypothetical protein
MDGKDIEKLGMVKVNYPTLFSGQCEGKYEKVRSG